MGDRLGIPGAVDFIFSCFSTLFSRKLPAPTSAYVYLKEGTLLLFINAKIGAFLPFFGRGRRGK